MTSFRRTNDHCWCWNLSHPSASPDYSASTTLPAWIVFHCDWLNQTLSHHLILMLSFVVINVRILPAYCHPSPGAYLLFVQGTFEHGMCCVAPSPHSRKAMPQVVRKQLLPLFSSAVASSWSYLAASAVCIPWLAFTWTYVL